MKLMSIYVAGFGCLRDADFDLNKEITVLAEENGFGKSTLAAFIRVMLFGFEGEKSRTELDKERVRYAPWQGGAYGGNIIIETARGRYRIERTFGSKAAEDTFTLFNADTNLPSSDYSENIGEELFGINAESFRRTVFITQDEVTTSVTGSINARIGAGSGDFSDMAGYENAIDTIEKLILRLGDGRKTGRLFAVKDAITAAAAVNAEREALAPQIERLRKQIKETEEECASLEKAQKKLLSELSEYRNTLSMKNEESKAPKSKGLRFSFISIILCAGIVLILTLNDIIPRESGIYVLVGAVLILAINVFWGNKKRLASYESEAPDTDKLAEITSKLNEKKNYLNDFVLRLDDLEDRDEVLAAKAENVESLKEERDDLTAKMDTLTKTRAFLTESKESLTAKYRSPLKQAFDKYYSLITGKDPYEFAIDANAELTLTESGITKSTGYLSRGMKDVAGLALRLAFIDAMQWDEEPFLILDEPFAFLDDENLEGAKRMLREVAKERQILVLSCRKEEI